MQKEEKQSRFDVSIIVPMAFHRGLALECIEGWTRSQSYPRDRYQIVIAAPQSLSASIVGKLREYLQPWDRLECYPFDHDIPLVAAAAKLAESEWLLFTESHCVPKPGALSHIMGIAAAHPEWAGFGGATAPVTYNLLSKITAEIYVTDIHDKLEKHVWLTVTGQRFLVRRNAYFDCGGFEPQYNHFAEWLLSASLRREGCPLGFDLAQVLRHSYIGNLEGLEKLTIDFACGQIKFAAENLGDVRTSYFPPIPELEEYRGRQRSEFYEMVRLRFEALLAIIWLRLRKRFASSVSLWKLIEDLSGWLLSGIKGAGGAYFHACITEIFARWKLSGTIRCNNQQAAHAAYVNWLDRLVHKGRLHYLVRSGAMTPPARNQNFSHSGRWRAGDHSNAVELLGFHDQEAVEDRVFYWSMHSACIYLPLDRGCYHVSLEWEPVRPLQPEELIRVEFDGHRVQVPQLSLSQTSLTVEVNSESRGWHRLSWSVVPFAAVGDRRLLGLPLSQVRWLAHDARLAA